MTLAFALRRKTTSRLDNPSQGNLCKGFVVFLANLSARALQTGTESTTQGSTQRRPRLHQDAPFVVFGNGITWMIGDAVGQLVDDGLGSLGILENTIELGRRKIGHGQGFGQSLLIHVLECFPLSLYGGTVRSCGKQKVGTVSEISNFQTDLAVQEYASMTYLDNPA